MNDITNKIETQRAVIEAAIIMNDITKELKVAIKTYQDNGLKCCDSCRTTAQKNECVVAFQHGYLASVARAENAERRCSELEAKSEAQRAVIEAAIMWADADPLRNPEVIEALDTAVAKYKGTIE